MILEVSVIEADVDDGMPCFSFFCPIALAATREARLKFGAHMDPEASVTGVGRYIWDPRVTVTLNNGEVFSGPIPEEAAEYAQQFDIGGDMDPPEEFDVHLEKVA